MGSELSARASLDGQVKEMIQLPWPWKLDPIRPSWLPEQASKTKSEVPLLRVPRSHRLQHCAIRDGSSQASRCPPLAGRRAGHILASDPSDARLKQTALPRANMDPAAHAAARCDSLWQRVNPGHASRERDRPSGRPLGPLTPRYPVIERAASSKGSRLAAIHFPQVCLWVCHYSNIA